MEAGKMRTKLDAFEQSIENSAELFEPVNNAQKAEIAEIIASANKTKHINIRIRAYDIEQVKQKASDEGIPYQTLISSIIHKYINGKLVDEQALLKSLQLVAPLVKPRS
jgi:predicted DNA binding CopG/RHH family protein